MLSSLEIDGVDNWQWYGTTEAKKYTESDVINEYTKGNSFDRLFSENQDLFYMNQKCVFEGYINKRVAVVSVLIELDTDIVRDDLNGSCMGCMVGDNDNKLSCTCEDHEYVLDHIDDLQDSEPQYTLLAVPVSKLFTRPFSVIQDEESVKKCNDKKKIILDKVKELSKKEIELKSSLKILESSIVILEARKNEFEKNEDNLKDFE